MTSKEDIDALKGKLIFYPSYLNIVESLEKDVKMLKILKSNIIDYAVIYGNDHEMYNTATITIQVKTEKEFTEKDIIGKEIHYTPCKCINNDDFELVLDMLYKRNESI